MSSGGSVVIELDVATGGAIRLHLGESGDDSLPAVEATPIPGDRHVISRWRPAGGKSFDELVIREREGLWSNGPRLRRTPALLAPAVRLPANRGCTPRHYGRVPPTRGTRHNDRSGPGRVGC